MNTEKYNIELTLDELEFLVDLTLVDNSRTGKKLARYFQSIACEATYRAIWKGQKDVIQPQEIDQKEIPMENNSTSNAPISITQLTSLGETIEDPIVIYYTAEGMLDPSEADKREVFICVESKEQSALGIWGKYLDMSQYGRQVISQRGEYKIVPSGKWLSGMVNVNFIGSDELHEFTDDFMLVTRTEVKDEAIETWFPQSNNGRYRDYSPDSIDDITQFNGPDSPIGEPNQLTDASYEVLYAIYIYA